MLTVVVDTEAEFDWAASTTRRAAGVTSVKALRRVQPLLEKYNVRPTLVVDYPVSTIPEGYEVIRDLHRSGFCEVGAHLQPWDAPPFEEEITEKNSYAGNLPAALEREKLVRLTAAIVQNIGVQPRIYKAGRYGVGPATPGLLRELGYQIDASVVPGTDLRRHLGPDFSRCPAHPYWFGGDLALLEVPMSVGYTGLAAGFPGMARLLTALPSRAAPLVRGVLARLRILDRIVLTPEGITFDEHRRLTRAMLRRGYRVFSLTFHSPSLAPGNTPYVRDAAQLQSFLGRIEQYLEFFMTEVGGQAVTPFEIKERASRLAAKPGRLELAALAR
ncbi:MAG: polysaccharide deacetylase family protein [Alphaproteobacteria bacterium]